MRSEKRHNNTRANESDNIQFPISKSNCRMSQDDRRFFPSDVRAYNFREFVWVYYIGIRLHVLKEYEYNFERAHRRLYILWILHWMLKIAVYALTILWLLSWWQQCGFWESAPQACSNVQRAWLWLFE